MGWYVKKHMAKSIDFVVIFYMYSQVISGSPVCTVVMTNVIRQMVAYELVMSGLFILLDYLPAHKRKSVFSNRHLAVDSNLIFEENKHALS